jgi:hypothetical protein
LALLWWLARQTGLSGQPDWRGWLLSWVPSPVTGDRAMRDVFELLELGARVSGAAGLDLAGLAGLDLAGLSFVDPEDSIVRRLPRRHPDVYYLELEVASGGRGFVVLDAGGQGQVVEPEWLAGLAVTRAGAALVGDPARRPDVQLVAHHRAGAAADEGYRAAFA